MDTNMYELVEGGGLGFGGWCVRGRERKWPGVMLITSLLSAQVKTEEKKCEH